MGHTIFYSRRFIKVEEGFIPMVLGGANNDTSYCSRTGRVQRDRSFYTLNYDNEGKLVFSTEEIIQLADSYRDSHFGYGPSDKTLTDQDLVDYIIGGMKTAKTIEEYTELGNEFQIGFSGSMVSVKTAEEFNKELKKTELKVIFAQSKRLRAEFKENYYVQPKKRKQPRVKKEVDHYFILTNESHYLYKMSRRGYRYSSYLNRDTKSFKTENVAQKYLDNHEFLKTNGFSVKRIDEKKYI